MQKLFVTLVAKDLSLAFVSPGTYFEDTLSLGASPVRRAPEKAFGDKMVFSGMASTLDRRTRIRAAFSVKPATTDCAMLDHCSVPAN